MCSSVLLPLSVFAFRWIISMIVAVNSYFGVRGFNYFAACAARAYLRKYIITIIFDGSGTHSAYVCVAKKRKIARILVVYREQYILPRIEFADGVLIGRCVVRWTCTKTDARGNTWQGDEV
jgi:hypothetical protein